MSGVWCATLSAAPEGATVSLMEAGIAAELTGMGGA